MLTGRTRYRIGFRKKLVMQVSYWAYPWQFPVRIHNPFTPTPAGEYWRDATVEDMQRITAGNVFPDAPEPKAARKCRPKPDVGHVPPVSISQPRPVR